MSLTIGTVLNFDDDCDGDEHGVGTCKQILTTIYILFLDAQEKSSTQDGTTTANTAQVNSNEPGGEGETDTTTTTSNSSNNSTNSKETVSFKVIYNKQKHDLTFPLDDTVIDLKKHLEEITGETVLLIVN